MRSFCNGVAGIALGVILAGVAFGQPTPVEPTKLSDCAKVHRSGHRIISNMEIVEFRIPWFSHFTKGHDVDYVEYYVRYGKPQDKLWLHFMFGPLVGRSGLTGSGGIPIKWTTTKSDCFNADVTDLRGHSADDRHWRNIEFPFGFAAYNAAPPKAADYFDKVLDTICCGKCSICKK